MFRSMLIALLTAFVISGCASMENSSADEYCLSASGTPCVEISGYSDCQPCPSVQSEPAGS